MPDYPLNAGITLVLGGARSGKSRFAESMIAASGLKPVYIATGRASDEEMSERIAIHRERRGKLWQTVEEPLALADTLLNESHKGSAILVDCLTLWVTNLMMAGADIDIECRSLVEALTNLKEPVVLVSNETGLGIIPDNAMARQFRDYAGNVNQAVARVADEAWFVVAGMPLALKPAGRQTA
jgi:adenosylcobinamide kinase/adenosylcobinamide-phosphate guanylyltransferase